MTGELINLNKARKARAKAAQKARASENRLGFGRSKAEKVKAETAADKIRRLLDGAKRDT